MQYWIDGYNLLFKLPYIKGSFEERRKKLIVELNKVAKCYHLSLILVFDAIVEKDRTSFRSHYDEIEIIYVTCANTADEYILREVETLRAPFCVVSSDKELTSKVRALGGQTLSLPQFMHFLDKKNQKKDSPLECRDSPKEIARLHKIFEDRLKNTTL